MAKYVYAGVDGVARRINIGYIGVKGVARRIKKVYIGDYYGKARLCYELASFTITFNANGGSGDTYTQTAYGHSPWVRANLNPNSFTPANGYYFTGWNTAADGSGKSFTNGDQVDLFADLTLYAQWSNIYTVRYRHTNNTGGMYDNNNTGPTDCYTLRIGGDDVKRKLGTFADDPGDTYQYPHSTLIEVVVTYKDGGTAYKSKNCRVYLNGVEVAEGDSAYYAFYLTGNVDINFRWTIAGSLLTLNAQSWWDCYITTA